MLLYDSTCACLILLYGGIIHADQGYTGTLEATSFQHASCVDTVSGVNTMNSVCSSVAAKY